MNMISNLLLVFFFLSMTCINANQDGFLVCINNFTKNFNQDSTFIHTQNSSSSLYINLLQSAEQNPRWFSSVSTRPSVIITPSVFNQIQATILCSQKNGMQIRVKSGGHDYEGLSSHSDTPFVMIDLVNFKSISVNLVDGTAWVQTGATLGEVYYQIASKSGTFGFPAGTCPSVGVGGHISGGGIGTLTRMYGVAADNVVDATIIDVNGRVLDRKAMGEDLFWAIRGGGGASFGVILAWKIKLVPVPSIVSLFRVQRPMDTAGIALVNTWQTVAPKLPNELFIRVVIQNGNDQQGRKIAVSVYESLFLGRKQDLINVMSKSFPGLGLRIEDITEMSWSESVVDFAFQNQQPLEVLLNRDVQYKSSFKGKSDYVENPIPVSAINGICNRVVQEEIVYVILEPAGGKMDAILETATPYPHRKGTLYNIQYGVKWGDNDDKTRHLNWMNELYGFMTPYVSNSPRRAYVNYRDLDIGMNNKQGNTSYLQASSWGLKYFKNNFKRLAQVKSKVDPGNFFRFEQSVPLM